MYAIDSIVNYYNNRIELFTVKHSKPFFKNYIPVNIKFHTFCMHRFEFRKILSIVSNEYISLMQF